MYQKSKHPNNSSSNNSSSNKFINAAVNILSHSSHLEYFMSVVLKPFSLTLQQFNALRILASHYPKPIVLKQLTEQMIDKSSNTSRLVDKLSEKNLAVRQNAPDNGRIVHISMTDEGLNLVGQVEKTLETNLTTHFAPHEKNAAEKLIETLKILRG